MSPRKPWLQIIGGGCFLNVALTGLVAGIFSALSEFTIDTIAFPFLMGATASFGLSLVLVRQWREELSSARRVLLALVGVVLGSIAAVLGIAVLLLARGV